MPVEVTRFPAAGVFMDKDWLQLAKDAYSTSTSYVDSNYRKKWDDAIRMFQSRHPSDSKYNTESYKHR